MSLSSGWFCIKRHLSIRIYFSNMAVMVEIVTKGKIFLCAFCFCVIAFFFSAKLTSA